MAKLPKYKAMVSKALRSAGLYSNTLGIQINSLASALLTLDIANAEIEELDTVLLENETSQGTTRVVHPVFRVQKDAMDQVTRQMKQLGLTTADIVGKPDLPDNGDDVLSKVAAVK